MHARGWPASFSNPASRMETAGDKGWLSPPGCTQNSAMAPGTSTQSSVSSSSEQKAVCLFTQSLSVNAPLSQL